MKLGIMHDPIFLMHQCGSFDHPECPERLTAVLRGLGSFGPAKSAIDIPAREATENELLTVHTDNYIEGVLETLREGGFGHLDPDTFYSPDTLQAALKAVGGGIDLTMAVQEREADVGLVVARPPGHHATWNRSMGFCIFNNVAAAARTISREKTEKVVIFDWDVHHGNGTQAQFWDDPNVLYISIHQWPFYPGTGHLNETGSENAPKTTANLPLPAGAQNEDYLVAMDSFVIPLIENFNPGHIMVSAGFDAHEKDPLASMRLSTDCYGEIAARLKLSADNLCEGRMTLFLEGGYNLRALEESIISTMKGVWEPSCKQKPAMDTTRQHQRIIRDAMEIFEI